MVFIWEKENHQDRKNKKKMQFTLAYFNKF